MNLESVATPATPATALPGMACSCCQPIKKVATTGNTHLRFNIRSFSYCPTRSAAMLDNTDRFMSAALPDLELAPEEVKAEKKDSVLAKNLELARKVFGGCK